MEISHRTARARRDDANQRHVCALAVYLARRVLRMRLEDKQFPSRAREAERSSAYLSSCGRSAITPAVFAEHKFIFDDNVIFRHRVLRVVPSARETGAN